MNQAFNFPAASGMVPSGRNVKGRTLTNGTGRREPINAIVDSVIRHDREARDAGLCVNCETPLSADEYTVCNDCRRPHAVKAVPHRQPRSYRLAVGVVVALWTVLAVIEVWRLGR